MKKRIMPVALGMVLLLLFPILLWSSSPINNIIQECAPDSSGGPDAYGYTWIDIYEPGGPVYNWVDITSIGTKVEGLTDDNNVGPFLIGFDFPYYWYYVDQFFVNANGAISFSDPMVYTPQGSSGFLIPSLDDPDDLLIPLGADLVFSAVDSAECYYYSNNVDTFIVSYLKVAAWDTSGLTGAHSFQLILTRQDSCIYFQYAKQAGQYYNGDNCAGIEDCGGGIGLQVFLCALPDSGYAVKFIPPDSMSSVEESKAGFPKAASVQLSISPNPFHNETEIRLVGDWERGRRGAGEIGIYDMAGRRVRHFFLYPSSFILGATWDGCDENGNVVAPGIYFLKLNSKLVGKVVKVK